MEGVFARGDRRLAPVLIRAMELGCRFDGWTEHFSLERWLQAFADCSIQPDWYLRQRDLDEVLPWNHLDCGVTRAFLLKERDRAFSETATEDCRYGNCAACGVCDFKTVTPHLSKDAALTVRTDERQPDDAARIRLRFAKKGAMRYLSHLELLNVFTRAVNRGEVPILFSQGFHPHPRFSFATATSVGVESTAEYMDMFVAARISADEVLQRLNKALPGGLQILEATRIDAKSPSLSTLIDTTRYRITFDEQLSERLPGLCVQFLAHTNHVIQRKRKGNIQNIDLRGEVISLAVSGSSLELVAGRGKPVEFARAIIGNANLQADDICVEKLEVFFTS